MGDIDEPSANGDVRGEAEVFPLMERTSRERWEIPDSLRGPLVSRLSQIIRDPNSAHRDVLSAASALMTASKINLANIDLSIKVQRHEELEQRMTEIERHIEAQKVGKREPG